MNSSHRRQAAFTFTELMLSTGVSAILFLAMVDSFTLLNRTYNEAENASAAVSDEERAMDYITRDLRCAYTVAVSGNGSTTASGTTGSVLTLTLPDYYSSYDAQGNPSGPPVTPTISTGLNPITYNNASQPITVVYYISGQQLIRQSTIPRISSSPVSLVVSNDLIYLRSGFFLPSTFGNASAANETSLVTVTLTFAPQFTLRSTYGANAVTGETLTAAVSVRNVYSH